jgi:hypothetical protein
MVYPQILFRKLREYLSLFADHPENLQKCFKRNFRSFPYIVETGFLERPQSSVLKEMRVCKELKTGRQALIEWKLPTVYGEGKAVSFSSNEEAKREPELAPSSFFSLGTIGLTGYS